MKITGSGREGLPKYNLEKMFLPLPPFAEQQRIVAEIKRWFAFVDQIEQSKANLQTAIKQAKSKILDLAIHGKLVPQDPNDEPAIELLKRINPDFIPCDNGHYTQLPQGWTVCKIKQITNITNGKSQKNVETPNGIYPIYGSGGVIGRANQYLCIAGSTIIGRKGTINNPIFVEEHFWNVDTAFGLKADSALLDKYLYYFCLSFDFSKLDKSTAMPSLTKTSIGDVLIPVPPYQEQKRIVSKIDTVLDTINVIMESL
ncbi:type I restriction modification DNA specificity domain protein [Bacteroides fragilis]|nr:type I restriction modification DNA specificity domain protein [Bacteroides fragilis]